MGTLCRNGVSRNITPLGYRLRTCDDRRGLVWCGGFHGSVCLCISVEKNQTGWPGKQFRGTGPRWPKAIRPCIARRQVGRGSWRGLGRVRTAHADCWSTDTQNQFACALRTLRLLDPDACLRCLFCARLLTDLTTQRQIVVQNFLQHGKLLHMTRPRVYFVQRRLEPLHRAIYCNTN